MATTKVTRLGYSTGNNSLPIFCGDPVAQARGTTDFCFDWVDPAQWKGSRPSAGAAQPSLDFANLALDNSIVLGRVNQAVSVSPVYAGTAHTSDGKGLTLKNGGAVGFALKRAGMATDRFGSPVDEGFRSFYLGGWFRLRAAAAQFERGILGRGQGSNIEYGLGVDHNTGHVIEFASQVPLVKPAVGDLVHVGLALDFDLTSNGTTARLFANGAEIQHDATWLRPTQWNDSRGNFDLGGLGGWGATAVTFARLTRTFTKWPGETALDPLKLHQDEERFRARLS